MGEIQLDIPKYFVYRKTFYSDGSSKYRMECTCDDKVIIYQMLMHDSYERIIVPIGDIKVRIHSLKEFDEYEKRSR